MNRQETEKYIFEEFGAEPEHLWASFPDYAVFRNKRNKKWFGVIAGIDYRKFGIDRDGRCEAIVIKCDPILIGSLIHNEGFCPGYHMSKKSWLTVLLDGSAPDEQIKDLLHLSFDIIDSKK
jgi:predicted DNA-binding protein (MmcQ/YjbR family)